VRWALCIAIAAAACRSPAPARPAPPLPPLPPAAYAHYLDGKLAAHRRDWRQATAALERARQAAPDQPMIVVELARALRKAKRGAEAGKVLAEARARWPGHAEVWLASGELLGKQLPAEAMRAFRRAIELAPDDERAYLGLARLEPAAAAEVTLRRLVARRPGSVDGRYQLAQHLARRGELANAQQELAGVLELDPDHLDARLDLARLLRRRGELERAIEHTRSAFDRSGQALDIADELFWILCEADDRTAALDLLALLTDDRTDVDALVHIARLHVGLGTVEHARAIAARLALVDAEAGELLAAELQLASDPAAAAARLLAIPATSARFAEARRLAAEALLAAGDPAGATAALVPARASRPRDVELAFLAARARADAGDPAGARALLGELGSGVGAQLARARLAEHVGDLAGAVALLEPVIRAHPDAAAALNLAGYLLAEQGRRLDDAERWLRAARELAPGDPAVLDSWGWLLYRKGAIRPAIRALDRAARLAPNEPEILLHLATAWAADDAPHTARAVLARARTLRPSPKLRARIDALHAILNGAR